MTVQICIETKLDLSKSPLNKKDKLDFLAKEVHVNGVGVFDDNGRFLPIISQYLSYQSKHEKLATESIPTYGKNLTYFLNYMRTRPEFDDDVSDEAFLTVPTYVIEEYITFLEGNQNLKSTTVRNRDACLFFFMKYLTTPGEDQTQIRKNTPYSDGYLSKTPKNNPMPPCNPDDLIVLLESTGSERERVVLQFLYDSGLRRSELPRVTVEHIKNAIYFNSTQFISYTSDKPICPSYVPLEVLGSKGRRNEINPRWTLISSATIQRILKYHASPLYKKYARKYATQAVTPAFLTAQGTAYTASSISKLLERLSKRAIKKGRLKKQISPHKLRHGSAYALLQSEDLGMDYLDRLVILQKNLGHSQLNTTEMYTKIPHEIYSTMCNEEGELVTKAEKMKRIYETTQLKINITDKK